MFQINLYIKSVINRQLKYLSSRMQLELVGPQMYCLRQLHWIGGSTSIASGALRRVRLSSTFIAFVLTFEILTSDSVDGHIDICVGLCAGFTLFTSDGTHKIFAGMRKIIKIIIVILCNGTHYKFVFFLFLDLFSFKISTFFSMKILV